MGDNAAGNYNRDVVKFNIMAPTRTRYIRFKPQTWREYNPTVNKLHVCLRTEVYGCSKDGEIHITL